MTNKQKMFIETVIPAMVESISSGGKNFPYGSIDEMAEALGAKDGVAYFKEAGLPLSWVIADSAIAMGAGNIPLLMELLQMFFGIGYDLGRIGAFDEMSEGDGEG